MRGGGECAKEKFEMQIGFNMDDSGLDKIRSNTSCRQPASGELAYSASLRQVHSSALHQAPAVPLTQQHRLLTMSRTPVYCPSDDRAPLPSHLLAKTNFHASDYHVWMEQAIELCLTKLILVSNFLLSSIIFFEKKFRSHL